MGQVPWGTRTSRTPVVSTVLRFGGGLCADQPPCVFHALGAQAPHGRGEWSAMR